MLTQYKLQLDQRLDVSDGYPLYAYLLSILPRSYGERLHEEGTTPISQYVSGDRWMVSLFGAEAEEQAADVLDSLKRIELKNGGRHIKVVGRECNRIEDVESLLNASLSNRLLIQLKTPTAFKSQGNYQLLPTQRLLVQSLIGKWNGCFSKECPIEDEGEGLDALAAGLVYRNVQIDTMNYRMKQAKIPGAIGKIELDNRLTGFHKQLIDMLLTFGTFSGLGIKTSLGMGGMLLREI